MSWKYRSWEEKWQARVAQNEKQKEKGVKNTHKPQI